MPEERIIIDAAQFTIRIGVSGEFFVAAHNFDAFIDICHLGSEFALRRLDLPADWTVNSVQVLEDRLLLLTRWNLHLLAIVSPVTIYHF